MGLPQSAERSSRGADRTAPFNVCKPKSFRIPFLALSMLGACELRPLDCSANTVEAEAAIREAEALFEQMGA